MNERTREKMPFCALLRGGPCSRHVVVACAYRRRRATLAINAAPLILFFVRVHAGKIIRACCRGEGVRAAEAEELRSCSGSQHGPHAVTSIAPWHTKPIYHRLSFRPVYPNAYSLHAPRVRGFPPTNS